MDAVGDAVLAVIKVMTCRMETTTTVNVGPNGQITSVVTTTRCAG